MLHNWTTAAGLRPAYLPTRKGSLAATVNRSTLELATATVLDWSSSSRELGLRPDDARLRRGIEWLQTYQRESGKWFTRSPVNEARNLILNVSRAYAVLALQACGELSGPVLDKEKAH